MHYQLGGADLFSFSDFVDTMSGDLVVKDMFAEDNKNIVTNKTGVVFEQMFLTSQREPVKDPTMTTKLDLQKIAEQGDMSWAISRIRARLSSFIREQGQASIQGRSYTSVTIVEVRWLWMILPIATWIMGSAFLFLTVRRCPSKSQLFWKTSSLPLMFHGVDPKDTARVIQSAATVNQADTNSVSGMEQLAKRFHVMLGQETRTGEMRLVKIIN